MKRIGFGGGCHWCTEAVFQSLRGVEKVEQGFIRAMTPDDDWSEAVIVHFDPMQIGLSILVDVHLHTHSATHAHELRARYRSAVYVIDEAQADEAEAALQQARQDFDKPLITRVLPLLDFRSSNPCYHNYYRSNPERPFCQRHIDPKLALLRKRFGKNFNEPQKRD